jgi:anaerobic magnesium-protoporphyrin IX monomethyl ester cyclase
LLNLAELLLNQQNPYCLTVYTRCDFYEKSTPELMRLLKQAGLVRVFIGIESANREDLKLYGKSQNFYHSEKAIQFFREHEIDISIGFINFNPFSTMERLYENLDFLQRNKLLCNRFPMHSRLSIYKGTALYEQFMREGYLKGDLTDDLSPVFNDSIRGLANYLSYFIGSKSGDNYDLQFFLNDHIINIRLILKYANAMGDDGAIRRIRHYQQILDEIRMKCEDRVYEWYSRLLGLTAKGFETGAAEDITSRFLNDEFYQYQSVIQREQRQMLKELIRKDKQYYTVFNRYVM